MSASETEVLDGTEQVQTVRKVRRLLREAVAKLREVDKLADSLGLGRSVEVKKIDEYGEPTWAYAVAVKIPVGIRLTQKFCLYASEKGYTITQASQLFEDFCIHFQASGKKWQNWTLVWMKWVRTDVKRKSTPARQGRFDRG